jgi:hypothetical protein
VGTFKQSHSDKKMMERKLSEDFQNYEEVSVDSSVRKNNISYLQYFIYFLK